MTYALIGNGFNIQFGGPACTSHYIVERLKYRARSGAYDPLFEGTLTGEQLYELLIGMVDLARRYINGELEEPAVEEELAEALDDFKRRYQGVLLESPHDLLLEDWLLVLDLHGAVNEDYENLDVAGVAFRRLLLDAIYNSGRLEAIPGKIDKKVRRRLRKYLDGLDEIYTVNYDGNLEQLTSRPVYHLHGAFAELQPTENPKNVLGYWRAQHGESAIIPGFEHCFANVLMDYVGYKKYATAERMSRANDELANVKRAPWAWHRSPASGMPSLAEIHALQEDHPEMGVFPYYPFDQFSLVQGTLDIIGMSPNNDQHILNLIRANPDIESVRFYCYSEADWQAVEALADRRIQPVAAQEFWNRFLIEPPRIYPHKDVDLERIGRVYEEICDLSDYKCTPEDILRELNAHPRIELDNAAVRCMRVIAEKDSAPDAKHRSEAEARRDFAAVSVVAAEEGISPAALYFWTVANQKRLES